MASARPFFQSPTPQLRHLELPTRPRRHDARARQRPLARSFRTVDRREHARALVAQIERIQAEFGEEGAPAAMPDLPSPVGLMLEIQTAAGYDLAAEEVHGIESGSEIRIIFARTVAADSGRHFTRVVIHVPHGSLTALASKFRRFGEEQTPGGNVPSKWVANVERVARAAFESLWTDNLPIPEGDGPHWWELWVRREPACHNSFATLARSLELRVKGRELVLPEHYVVVVHARRSTLEGCLPLLDTLAEIRHARPPHLEFSSLPASEQQEWVNEARDRIVPPPDDAPAVCLLDTGVNRGHPLIAPALEEGDNQSVLPGADASDSADGHGHGTPMAGLAAYGDLRELLFGTGPWPLQHRLEAVKMFDDKSPHEPENYGSVTIQAVSATEIVRPRRERVLSLPITARGQCDGRPSAWSAAIDSLAFGGEEGGGPRRLFFVSAGNVDVWPGDYDYPSSNASSPIEDPAQAWNAITVGATADRDTIGEGDPESRLLRPLARSGDLSPHSRTSCGWDPHWPIKPDIVMDGGNLALHPTQGVERRDSLEPLSTSGQFRHRPIIPFRATSAATALAARLGARIRAEYPDLWPETVRGLLVHSARWTPEMLGTTDPHRAGASDAVQDVLRRYGYGRPDADRALHCSENEVTLFRQDTFHPFEGAAGSARLNDCHVHALSLPAGLLQELRDAECRMRVTLSYFTAPNPGMSNRIPGSRYRYGGFLLRFRVRHRDESESDFLSHVALESEEESDGSPTSSARSMNDSAWAVGPKLRAKGGSLVHDVWRGSAADLVTMDRIAVFPVKGWWATKSFPPRTPWHHCHLRRVRYSLIVSIEVAADVRLYTAIRNLVSVPVAAT